MVCSQYFPKWLLTKGAAKDHIDKMNKTLNDQFSAIVLPFKPTCPNLAIIDRRKNNPIWPIAQVVYDVYYQKEWDFGVDLRFVNLRSECIAVVRKELSRDSQNVQMDGYEATKKASIDSLIAGLTREFEEVNEQNTKTLARIDKRVNEALAEEKFFLPRDLSDDCVMDLHSICETERKYIKHLEDSRFCKRADTKKNHLPINKFLEQLKTMNAKVISNDTYVCQICNGGDTQDQNSIVFCARCSVTVHQRCIRLEELPNQDWICDLCLEFKDRGRYMRCVMCTRRGGVMLETDCQTSSEFIKSVYPAMHVPKKKKNANRNPQNQTVMSEAGMDDYHEQSKEADRERYKEFYQNLYYNYFREPPEYTSKRAITEDPEVKKLEPAPSRFWVHSSCAYWLQGLEFEADSGLIAGVEQVDLRRFRLRCGICGQSS
jgi:bromodomain and PHD finger-containing protein 1